VDVPDADVRPVIIIILVLIKYITLQLDEEGLKEKRKQKLLKAGWEARVRARNEKQREREEREADERREIEDRERDLVGWATKLRKEQEVNSFFVTLVLIMLNNIVST
jgi:hypothetical protein